MTLWCSPYLLPKLKCSMVFTVEGWVRAADPFAYEAKGQSALFILVSLTCRALTVDLIGALADFDDVAVRIADVAPNLSIFGDWLGDEFGSATFP